MEYYEQIVKNRNSCRSFADKKVDDDALNTLLTYYIDVVKEHFPSLKSSKMQDT